MNDGVVEDGQDGIGVAFVAALDDLHEMWCSNVSRASGAYGKNRGLNRRKRSGAPCLAFCHSRLQIGVNLC
jgi:hypothetical protein